MSKLVHLAFNRRCEDWKVGCWVRMSESSSGIRYSIRLCIRGIRYLGICRGSIGRHHNRRRQCKGRQRMGRRRWTQKKKHIIKLILIEVPARKTGPQVLLIAGALEIKNDILQFIYLKVCLFDLIHHILSKKLSDFDEICHNKSDQDGPFFKTALWFETCKSFRHNFWSACPILAKFV